MGRHIGRFGGSDCRAKSISTSFTHICVRIIACIVTVCCTCALLTVLPYKGNAFAQDVFTLGTNQSTVTYTMYVEPALGNGQYGEKQELKPNENGSFDFDPTMYDNDHGRAHFEIRNNFSIPTGALGDTHTVVMHLPDTLKVAKTVDKLPFGDHNTEHAGTFSIDDAGRVTLELNDATVQENHSAPLEGHFTYTVEISDQGMEDGGTWDLPGSSQHVQVGKNTIFMWQKHRYIRIVQNQKCVMP